MKANVSIKMCIEEIIALERCLADRDGGEAFRLLKSLAEKVRHAQATS